MPGWTLLSRQMLKGIMKGGGDAPEPASDALPTLSSSVSNLTPVKSTPRLSSSASEAVCAVVPNESAEAPAPCGTDHGGGGAPGGEGAAGGEGGGGSRVSAMIFAGRGKGEEYVGASRSCNLMNRSVGP